MGRFTRWLVVLGGSSLFAGCSLPTKFDPNQLNLPQSFNLPNSPQVKRVYCSIKSIGIDLHFNSKTGQLYTFNEFNQSLEPFSLEKEIPFTEFFPQGSVSMGLMGIGGPVGSLEDGNLSIQVFDKTNPKTSVKLLINLDTLQTELDLSNIDSGYNAPSQRDANTAKAFVSKSLTCEYINPQSTKLS